MIARTYPSVIAVIDNSGLPVFTLPSDEHFTLVSSLASIIVSMTKTTFKEEIDYIKVDDGVIFLKLIGDKGSLLMYFRKVDDPSDASWIVQLFLNHIEEKIRELVEGFITSREIEEISTAYQTFIQKLKHIYAHLDEINNKIKSNRKLDKSAESLLKNCSNDILCYTAKGTSINCEKIRERRIRIDEVLKAIANCLEKIK